MAERRVVGARPHPAPVGNDRDHPPRRREHPPDLPQQPFRIVGHFQRMHQQYAVDRGLRQRHGELIDQGGQRGARGRPFQYPLCRRDESDATLGVFTKKSEIGRGIADAEHALSIGARPAFPDGAIDQLPRHDAKTLRVEITEIDDVDAHDDNVTRPSGAGRAEYCIALSLLTPYLSSSRYRARSLKLEMSWPPRSEPSPA